MANFKTPQIVLQPLDWDQILKLFWPQFRLLKGNA